MHGKTKVVKSDVVKKRDRQTDRQKNGSKGFKTENIAASRNKSFPYFKRTYKTNKMERLEKYGLKTSFDDIFTLNFVFLHVLVFMEVIN